MLLKITPYVLVYHWASSSAPPYPSSSRKKTSFFQRLFLFLDAVLVASIRAFRDWLRCKKPSPSRSDHPSHSCLLFLSMLVSIFHPYSFGVNIYSLFYSVTFVAHMRKRFCFVLNTKLMLILTATITHQTLYFPCDRGYCYMAHAASLMVWFEIMDGYRTSTPKSLLCSITPM